MDRNRYEKVVLTPKSLNPIKRAFGKVSDDNLSFHVYKLSTCFRYVPPTFFSVLLTSIKFDSKFGTRLYEGPSLQQARKPSLISYNFSNKQDSSEVRFVSQVDPRSVRQKGPLQGITPAVKIDEGRRECEYTSDFWKWL